MPKSKFPIKSQAQNPKIWNWDFRFYLIFEIWIWDLTIIFLPKPNFNDKLNLLIIT